MDKDTVIIDSIILELFGRSVEITLREINVTNKNRATRFFIKELKNTKEAN